jgi:biopolymer transport protein ExbD
MKFRRNKGSKLSSFIDISQLVSVIFLLLVFSILAMGVPLGLERSPETPKRETHASGTTNVLVLKGKILVNGHESDDQALKAIPSHRDIVVLASGDIPYSRVTRVLDVLKVSGHTRLSLTTRPAGR